jgi:hypothetical protein
LRDPLLIELELLFSCLIRKRVKFPSQAPAGGQLLEPLHPGLAIYFHPIATRHCRLDQIDGETPSDTFPLAKPDAFVPRWLSLDYRNGSWHGEFGYTD